MKIIRSKDIPAGPAKSKESSTFVVVHSTAGKIYSGKAVEGTILFNEKGAVHIEIEDTKAYDLATGKLLMIPPLSGFSISPVTDSTFHICRLSLRNHFTESTFPLQWIYETDVPQGGEPQHLQAHEKIATFFSILAGYVEDGLSTHLFYTHKARELMFLMKSYYARAELAAFFRPLADRDHEFADFILSNYRKYRTVQELAEASCHSLSSFNKLFRKTFGRSPYSWIREQRADDIYYDIITTNRPLKEICSDHGFHSLSQFTNFCKSQFGVSPRRLRESPNDPGRREK